MSQRPAAVVFDMDGVLCRYHFETRLARLAQITGVSAETINEVIWEQGFDEDADRGRYTAAEYHRLFCERIGAPLSKEQWLEARAVAMEPDPEVLDMARRVKQRAILAMLTNNGPLLQESIGEVFPEAVEIFEERAYFSCEFDTAKPEPDVFLRVVERLRVKPEETLFIDDTESYIDGATRAGLLTHHFRSAQALRETLASLSLLG